ncbi:hypothetical protein Y032_0004g2020 [Ancylostoma ceylanicum]|uniref:Uncharacterized protein n=1 Tax=Ancylostoma ceylanicum TaxID=53326 RepID=A0A016VTQ2_9BILA|nr:hypothetical protein Y032_0004g1776 [Ancylostoma ceylanicum]EYC31203.1 hypothetical protein Y032_0004g2020 [Ancylostoma ceylanicum]
MDPLSSQHRKGRADPRRCSQTEMPSREMTMFLMPVSLKKNWCLGTLCLIGLVFRWLVAFRHGEDGIDD